MKTLDEAAKTILTVNSTEYSKLNTVERSLEVKITQHTFANDIVHSELCVGFIKLAKVMFYDRLSKEKNLDECLEDLIYTILSCGVSIGVQMGKQDET